MPYTYNAQGQLVWTDEVAPRGGTAVTTDTARGGVFTGPQHDPTNPLDHLGDRKVTQAGGGMDTLLGPAPSGYHWMSDGTLAKDSFATKLDNAVMSPKGFALGITGMAAIPALASAAASAGASGAAGAAGGAGSAGAAGGGSMSLLGTLGKLALGLVPGGGTAATVANLVGAGLDAAGNIEKGREAGRASDNANTMNQDVLRQRAAQDFEGNVENRAGIDLQQRKFAQDSQSDAFKKAILSSVMQNLKDVKLNMPKNIPVFDFGNGLRPSALGSQGLDAAKVMQQLAMEKLMNGEKFDAMPALQQFQPSALKSGGKLDTILGIAGATGNVLDQLGAASKGNEQDTLIKRLLAAQKQQQPAGDVPTTLTNPSGMFGGAGVPLASDQYLFH